MQMPLKMRARISDELLESDEGIPTGEWTRRAHGLPVFALPPVAESDSALAEVLFKGLPLPIPCRRPSAWRRGVPSRCKGSLDPADGVRISRRTGRGNESGLLTGRSTRPQFRS